jgi:hypothetical protein
MNSKPAAPPDRTETIRLLIAKWKKKNGDKPLGSTPDNNGVKTVVGKEKKAG